MTGSYSWFMKEEFEEDLHCNNYWDKNREYDVIEKTLALVVVVDNDSGVLYISTLISNNIWIIDSCVTNHITFDSNL
jgi:hypothetical protein